MPKDRLLKVVDWFVPDKLQANTAGLWQARIFVISHLLGPFSAVVILAKLYFALEDHDAAYWMLCVLCGAFWLLPSKPKLTRNLSHVALFSICDLTFVSVFGSFFFGGVSSPFLPWFLTALLLGFFYLGDRPLLVLSIFSAHLAGFCVAYVINGSFPERVPLQELSTIGVISVCAATLYTSMMAIYYAYVMTAQSAPRKEIDRHLITAIKLRETKAGAERANEAKAVFLAKMNHQLRTPLNAIIGYSEILLDEMDSDSDASHVSDLKIINSAGRHLMSLLSDVLYMPKIEAEDVDLSIRAVYLPQFLDEVASTCNNLVRANHNGFLVEYPHNIGTANIDDTKVRQILINLLSNSGKFTKNGQVRLSANHIDDGTVNQLIISVEDTGIGIPADVIDGLFTEFNRGSNDTWKSYEGTGLGLAVSRKLSQLMGGNISVSSECGRGSIFTVSLPLDHVKMPIAA